MSKVHSLFYSSDPDKQTLHRRITPNQKQHEVQQNRWNDLRDYLIADLEEESEYKISSWLQGSYKFGTQVRPARKGDEFDIDLGIYFHWAGGVDEGNFSPRELKALIQNSLFRYEKEAEDVIEVVTPSKERCSRIRFSGNFHIDIPSYHLDEEQDERTLATESDKWEHSDPKAFYLWFREHFSDEESSQVRRLIRYVKIWASLQLKKPPSSVLLTVLAAEAYLELSESEIDGDDIALKYIGEKIAERLRVDTQVFNPVDGSENLNRLTTEEINMFVEKLDDLVDLANRALDAPNEFESATVWSEIFEHFFPVPVENPTDPKNRALTMIRFVPEVYVRAIPRENKNHQYTGENRIGPIPRNCNIDFTLKNASALPLGVNVQWVVRNEGEEAEYINDLGHLAGTDPKHAEESSAYKGDHYMDIVVTSPLKEVLGFRRIPVEISGVFMPPRNPKKPGYTKIRRR